MEIDLWERKCCIAGLRRAGRRKGLLVSPCRMQKSVWYNERDEKASVRACKEGRNWVLICEREYWEGKFIKNF
jgi:hypothetical protein